VGVTSNLSHHSRSFLLYLHVSVVAVQIEASQSELQSALMDQSSLDRATLPSYYNHGPGDGTVATHQSEDRDHSDPLPLPAYSDIVEAFLVIEPHHNSKQQVDGKLHGTTASFFDTGLELVETGSSNHLEDGTDTPSINVYAVASKKDRTVGHNIDDPDIVVGKLPQDLWNSHKSAIAVTYEGLAEEDASHDSPFLNQSTISEELSSSSQIENVQSDHRIRPKKQRTRRRK
jgi:hypothetical protein